MSESRDGESRGGSSYTPRRSISSESRSSSGESRGVSGISTKKSKISAGSGITLASVNEEIATTKTALAELRKEETVLENKLEKLQAIKQILSKDTGLTHGQ